MSHRKSFVRAPARQLELLEPRRLLAVTPAGNEFRVNTTTTDNQFAPAIAMDNNGNFVVVWSGDNGVGGHAPNTDIYFQRYNASGVAQGVQTVVAAAFTTGIQANPSVAMDADGDFVIVWESGSADPPLEPSQDGSGFGVFGQRFNASGTPQGSLIAVNQTTAGDQLSPRVSMDANGNFVVAWESTGQDGSGFGVYARRYNSAGTALSNEFRANTFTTDNQLDPAVAVDPDGDFVITWTSGNLTTGQDGSFYGVYAQRYNASGTAQGAEFRVNAFTTDFQADSRVAMDGAGNFVVTWNSFGQDGSDYGVYARKFSAAGGALTGDVKVNTFTSNAQSESSVDIDSAGNFTGGIL